MNRRRMEFLVLAMTLLATTSAKRTSTKTKLDIRVVRSPQHATDAASAYVLTSQAKTEEEHQGHQQQVSLLSEAQYEALLKQAQKALQGYDLTKLTAAARQAVQHAAPVVHQPVGPLLHHAAPVVHHAAPVVHHSAPATTVVEEHSSAKVIYKPEVQLKYVYPTSVAYNTAPAVYGSRTNAEGHGDHEDYVSKFTDICQQQQKQQQQINFFSF